MAGNLDLRRISFAMPMPLARYAVVVAVPTVLGTIVAAVAMALLMPGTFSGLMVAIPWGLPLLVLAVLVMYPVQLAQSRQHEMDHSMHYFITHMGTLATSRVPPVELFRLLGQKEEYGALAKECEKVATLVVDWNLSLAEACRFVAQRTPSMLFADFLERFAFGVESGADMEQYLAAEQEVVMADYETLYKSTLYNIDSIKTTFNGVIMTIIFMAMFALVMPVLVGGSGTMVLIGVIGMTLLAELGFLALIRSKVPPDPVWAETGTGSILWQRLKTPLPMAALASVTLLLAMLVMTDWHLAIVSALAVSPLAVPGYMATRAENNVKRRDDNYPAFIRSLGASVAARGGDPRDVLRHLRHHDFGPLTDNIRALFTRLQLRVDDATSWQYFTTEAGSRLVQRFTNMYDEAVDTGGRPDAIGRIISDNMVRILGLRKLRYQQAGGFRGTTFSLAAGIAFSIFIGIGVLGMLLGLFDQFAALETDAIEVPTVIHTEGIDVPMMETLAVVMLLINAAASAAMTRLVDGGTKFGGLADFTWLVWVSNLTALASAQVMKGMLDSTAVVT